MGGGNIKKIYIGENIEETSSSDSSSSDSDKEYEKNMEKIMKAENSDNDSESSSSSSSASSKGKGIKRSDSIYSDDTMDTADILKNDPMYWRLTRFLATTARGDKRDVTSIADHMADISDTMKSIDAKMEEFIGLVKKIAVAQGTKL
jgi:hypothetical protein